jgi:hypothetical protein
MPKRTSFASDHFILCEGEEDAAFARALIKGGNLGLLFDVSPNIDVGGVGGNSGFGRSFLAIEPITGFTDVKHVIVLADNDGDPAAALASTIDPLKKLKQTNSIKRVWADPTRAGARFPGDPSVSVWMWPAPGQQGCLETLLWSLIETKYPKDAACAVDACRCSGANKWSISKFHKARVRCFLSLICQGNPAVSLSLLWRDYEDIIPVDHPTFKPFSDFLRQFTS